MTPLADLLRRLRKKRQLKQSDVASLAGIDQCYLSSLENGHKDSPSDEVVEGICAALNLNEQEKRQLFDFRHLSIATVKVPKVATLEERRLVHSLIAQLGGLSEDKVKLLQMLVTAELIQENKGKGEII